MNLPARYTLCPKCHTAYRPPDPCRCEPAKADAPLQSAPTPAQEKWQRGEEGKFHRIFAADLDRRGVTYIHSIFGRKSTVDLAGCPDFVCLYTPSDGIPRCCCVELKADGATPTKDQRECIAMMNGRGIPVLVTSNLADAINFVREHLHC